jgi:glycerol-3-phosphate acyltransferase PlsY
MFGPVWLVSQVGGGLADLMAIGAGDAALIFIAAYAVGAIPFGLIFTWLAGAGDIRKIGSGNIGATNVLRAGRRGLAAATLLADAGKGLASVLIAREVLGGADGSVDAAGVIAGFGAFLGHLFPIYLGFRGGKGVATYIGVVGGLFWPGAVAFCSIWLLVAAITRYSSLSALVAAIATPIFLGFSAPELTSGTAAAMSLLLILRHHKNIANLISGRESKIGQRSG